MQHIRQTFLNKGAKCAYQTYHTPNTSGHWRSILRHMKMAVHHDYPLVNGSLQNYVNASFEKDPTMRSQDTQLSKDQIISITTRALSNDAEELFSHFYLKWLCLFLYCHFILSFMDFTIDSKEENKQKHRCLFLCPFIFKDSAFVMIFSPNNPCCQVTNQRPNAFSPAAPLQQFSGDRFYPQKCFAGFAFPSQPGI